MGQDAVQGILEGLKIAQARRTENMRAAQESARLQADSEYRQKQLENEAEDRKQRKNQFDITTKAAAAMHNLQLLQEEQRITGNLQSGMSIPGMQQTGSDTDHVTYQIPGMENPITVLNPTAYNKMLGDRKLAEETPAFDAALKKQTVADEARAAREAEAAQANHDRTVELQKMKDASELIRTNITANSRLAAASLKANKDKDAELENFDPAPYLAGLANGRYTAADISKLGKKQAQLINGLASKSDVIGINDEQKKFLEGIGPAIEPIAKMDQFNEATASDAIGSRIPFSEKRNNLTNLIDQIKSGVVSASTGAFGQSARALSQALKADTGAYTPTLDFTYSSTNKQKRDAYVHAVNDAIDQKLGNLSVAQRHHIKEQFGLDKFLENAGPVPKPGNKTSAGGTHLYYDTKGNLIPQGGK